MSDTAVWVKIDEHSRQLSEHREELAVLRAGLKSVEERGERMASDVAGLRSEVKQGNDRISQQLSDLSTQFSERRGAHSFAWKALTVVLSVSAICATLYVAV